MSDVCNKQLTIYLIKVFAMSEATDQDAASLRRSLNDRDVVCNADLYVFNHEVDNG